MFVAEILNKKTMAKQVTNSEIETILLKKDGRTNKEIAKAFKISTMKVSAVYSHLVRKSLLPKLTSAYVPKKPRKQKELRTIKVKKTTNLYSNSNGANKQIARDKMEKAILASKSFVKSILTLPFQDCKMERQLLTNVSPKLKFLGCEMIDETYNNMLMTIAKNNLPISTHKGMIGEVIREAKANQFSNIILDYCGQFATYADDIKIAMENFIVGVNGAICITANKRIHVSTFGFYEQMEKLNPPFNLTEDTRCVHGMITFINRIAGMNYSIEEKFDYNDGQGRNMVLIIVRRIQ